MKSMRGFGDTMNWSETGRRAYELRAGSDVVATLQWTKGYGSPAQAETADGRVIIERIGLLRPRVVIREDLRALDTANESDAAAVSQRPPLVTLNVDLSGRGDAHLPDDKILQWRPLNIWRTSWAIDDGGKTVMKFDFDSIVPKFVHRVQIVDASANNLGTLVLLGSAVGVLLKEDIAVFAI